MTPVDVTPEVQRAEHMNLFVDSTDIMCEKQGTTWSEIIQKLAEDTEEAASYLEQVPESLQADIDELFVLAEDLEEAEETGVGLYLKKVATAELVIKISSQFEKENAS